ncbi:unnamed protein product, partial [Prorocentrum cordatum]
SPGPVLLRAPCGRRVLRCWLPLGDEKAGDTAQRVAASSDDPGLDAAMLGAYHAAVRRAAAEAPRVPLSPGEALVLDGRRALLGCGAASGGGLFWRAWAWAGSGGGGEGHSGLPTGPR